MKAARAMPFLDLDQLPPECAEFSETKVVALIGGEHSYAQLPDAYRNQRFVGQPPLSDLFVIIFLRQAGQHPVGLSPVTEIGHQDSFQRFTCQSLVLVALPRAANNRTQT
jgi:hypothetical protein